MAATLLKFSRKFSSQKALQASLSEPLKADAVGDHSGSYLMWKRLFIFVCCPAVAVTYLNFKLTEEPKRPEFIKYQYLRIRNKKYPWRDGVQTLFHNPHRNALPEGYEAEEEHH